MLCHRRRHYPHRGRVMYRIMIHEVMVSLRRHVLRKKRKERSGFTDWKYRSSILFRDDSYYLWIMWGAEPRALPPSILPHTRTCVWYLCRSLQGPHFRSTSSISIIGNRYREYLEIFQGEHRGKENTFDTSDWWKGNCAKLPTFTSCCVHAHQVTQLLMQVSTWTSLY